MRCSVPFGSCDVLHPSPGICPGSAAHFGSVCTLADASVASGLLRVVPTVVLSSAITIRAYFVEFWYIRSTEDILLLVVASRCRMLFLAFSSVHLIVGVRKRALSWIPTTSLSGIISASSAPLLQFAARLYKAIMYSWAVSPGSWLNLTLSKITFRQTWKKASNFTMTAVWSLHSFSVAS